MQSSETKAKRKRKTSEEISSPQVQPQASGQEETPKLKRRTTPKKSSTELTSAVKQHRPAVRKSSVSETVIPPTPTIVPLVTREQIAILAYSYWEKRGYRGGSPEEDWLRAERELRSR